MKKSEFVHLHVHSDYSLLDGYCRTKDLAATAKREGMRAVALTDHGNLFGAVNFYQSALDAGVKPIIGYEAYVAPGNRREKAARSASEAGYHLTLLAMNSAGYANLLKLASLAYLEGFYYKPRIDKELLQAHSDGLICLSGCSSGEICRLLANDDYPQARRVAEFYRDLFGPERFYIEIQDNGLEVQRSCLKGLDDLRKELGLRPVATNDAHYMTRDDAVAHEVLLCISTGTTLSSDNRLRLGSPEFYFKSAAEMHERFAWIPDALTNTIEIADRCNAEIAFGQRHFPHFMPEDGSSSEAMLRRLCEAGLNERYGTPTEEMRKRLAYELDVIERMHFPAYFLIVWDIVRFAREQRIPHGLRGSGTGSLVSYVLHLSDIDPVGTELLFERFLDPMRREAPDLDLDICARRRDEVIGYVKRKYGDDHTAQIVTFGTLGAKAVVRDVGRALDFPLSEVDQIARLIPDGPDVELKNSVENDPELKRRYGAEGRIHQLIDIALKLEGLTRHPSTHAAGVVIADKPLTEYIPLCTINDVILSQYDMEDLEKLGMLKMDLLGLRQLTIVEVALDLVEAREGRRPDLNVVAINDEETYRFLSSGDTRSVFQLSSEGMQKMIHRLEPRTFDNVTAALALYRPGPLQAGVVDQFINRKHGREEITYQHPSLEPILKGTYGLMIYQEQIMLIAHRVAGMDMGDALTMIKAISKKKESVIQERRERFLAGAKRNGLSGAIAGSIFDDIARFAQYGFNKAHAAAYAFLAMKTAYLKTHYPVELLAAAMTCEMEKSDKIMQHRQECRALDIELVGPSINDSQVEFTAAGPRAIRFGLGAVRNAGQKAMEEVVRARNRSGRFESLHQFCQEVDLHKVNKSAIEALIKAGAFDCVPGNRAQKVSALEEAMRSGSQIQRDKSLGQATFFGALDDKRATVHTLPRVEEWPRLQLLTHERDAIGFYLSGHPLESDAAVLKALATATSASLTGGSEDARVIMGGMIKDLRTAFDKRGQTMALFELEDLEGAVRGVAFASTWERYGRYLTDKARVFVVGRADVRTGKPSVVVDEVVPMAGAFGRFSEAVRIRLVNQPDREQAVQRLRQAMASHRGECPVLIDVPCDDGEIATVKVSPDMYVAPTQEFVSEVEGILGKGALEFVPARNSRHAPAATRG